ncbi:MAG: VanW family protein [Lysinibacillus sp.]
MKKRVAVLMLLMGVLAALVLPLGSFKSAPAYADDQGSKSTIAQIEVSGLEGDEMRKALTEAIAQWRNGPLIVADGERSIEIDKAAIQFDIDKTVSLYESMTKRKWYAFWQEEQVVHLPLEITHDDALKEEISRITTWDEEATYAEVINHAAYLRTGEVVAIVEDSSAWEVSRIALAIAGIPEAALGTYEIASVLDGKVIGPGETFSFIQTLGETIDTGNGEALNFVASLLYQNALSIQSEIVERHSQHKVPVYLEPGIEAAVDSRGGKDLQFINRLTTPIKLKLSLEEQQLKTEIYTSQQEEVVEVMVVRDEEINPRTIIRFSDALAAGQVREVQNGEQGLRVSVYRMMDGAQELISRDYYPPVNRILLKSSRQLEQPAETDPDLQLDLDGDGLADVESNDGAESEDTNENEERNENEREVDEDGNPVLPPGSYYDKGGNLITP